MTAAMTAFQGADQKNAAGYQVGGAAVDAQTAQDHILHHAQQYQQKGIKRPFQHLLLLQLCQLQLVQPAGIGLIRLKFVLFCH